MKQILIIAKRILKIILRIISNFFRLGAFLFSLRKAKHKEILKYEGRIDGRIAVIATGPSLKEDMPYIVEETYKKSTDILMLNFSAFDPMFFELRPKHYCLADPMYFRSSWRNEEVSRFFDVLNTRVDWDMTIYVQAIHRKSFLSFSKLSNPHLAVVGINTFEYKGFEGLRYWFYKKGLASPPPQTVTNMAVFVGIQKGYSEMDLFGVDHTFLSALRINEKNQLCQKYYHSYDKGEPEYKIIYRTDNNEVWRCGEYIIACGKMFISHDMLEKYAKSLGCRIVNHTKCSMIDSYERFVD